MLQLALLFQKRFYPVAYLKFQKVPNTYKWHNETFDFLESVVMRIENKNGRLQPQVVASDSVYKTNRENIRNRIEKGLHFR